MKLYALLLILLCVCAVRGQVFERDFSVSENGLISVNNLYGRVSVIVEKSGTGDAEAESEAKKDSPKASLAAPNIKESDLKITSANNRLEIVAAPAERQTRIDLTLRIPAGMRLKIETKDGEVRIDGAIRSAEIKTETGTIAANVPLEAARYDFVWTESRPRFLSDVELGEVDEKAAGKFVISGRVGEQAKGKRRKGKGAGEDEAETAEKSEPETENEI
ncbi:MAG: hypothetical protein M3T96_00765, partial [Acidobacteriota bacterium]|nr:hypothetical protein [Acidobacteriota bacterium]